MLLSSLVELEICVGSFDLVTGGSDLLDFAGFDDFSVLNCL